jgi:hypothetical protein
MSILDPIRTYSTPLTLVLVIFGPQVLSRILAYLSRRKLPSSSPAPRSPPLSQRLKVFLALHTLYQLAHLLIPPYDVFSTPHLPILAPNDLLRSRLSPNSNLATSEVSSGGTNALMVLLLSRLQNLDNRLTYIRFGHRTVQDCLWCLTPLDYLIASLPDILGRYVWTAGVLLILGNDGLAGEGAGRRGKRWGRAGLWVVGLMGLAEIGIKYLWDLRIAGGDCLHVSQVSRGP